MPIISVYFRIFVFIAALVAPSLSSAAADERFIVLQSTTSTKNSGLYDYLLPKFHSKTGIDVRVVAVGTGQALRNAQNGDGDVLIVHAKAAEEKFVANGYGTSRQDLMYNDFVIVGPSDDPAKIAGAKTASEAFARIAGVTAAFASRGDNSGTHKKERKIWEVAKIDPVPQSGKWYRELGAGMGATLNASAAMGAYTLTDRATWLSFQNKQNLTILVESDPGLFNQYGVILVNPKRHPHVKAKLAQTFIDWLLGTEGQAAIASHKLNGKQLFIPNAR